DCILSLKGLEFVDSTGLQLFLQLHRRLQQEGGYRLVLIEVPVVVGQLFKITKVERLLHVFKDMPSALGFLSGTLPEK
ncbi:MAG: STAS domain-containing protein, partial [Verrucomicrobiota bacterium]|nr:STAS domain-containing protein [Verrucomicrobiota bacterium]